MNTPWHTFVFMSIYNNYVTLTKPITKRNDYEIHIPIIKSQFHTKKEIKFNNKAISICYAKVIIMAESPFPSQFM